MYVQLHRGNGATTVYVLRSGNDSNRILDSANTTAARKQKHSRSEEGAPGIRRIQRRAPRFQLNWPFRSSREVSSSQAAQSSGNQSLSIVVNAHLHSESDTFHWNKDKCSKSRVMPETCLRVHFEFAVFVGAREWMHCSSENCSRLQDCKSESLTQPEDTLPFDGRFYPAFWISTLMEDRSRGINPNSYIICALNRASGSLHRLRLATP